MNNSEIISYAIIAAGLIVTLLASYQMYKKGLILWVALAVVGITAINYGFTASHSVEGFMDELNAGKLARYSKAKLVELCTQQASR